MAKLPGGLGAGQTVPTAGSYFVSMIEFSLMYSVFVFMICAITPTQIQPCTVCPKVFTADFYLTGHVKRRHPDQATSLHQTSGEAICVTNTIISRYLMRFCLHKVVPIQPPVKVDKGTTCGDLERQIAPTAEPDAVPPPPPPPAPPQLDTSKIADAMDRLSARFLDKEKQRDTEANAKREAEFAARQVLKKVGLRCVCTFAPQYIT